MRLGCLLIVIGVGMTVTGWEGIHNANSFKRPEVISYAEFEKSKPQEGWFRVTGCTIDVAKAVYERSSSPRGYKIGADGSVIELTPEERVNDIWIRRAWFPVYNQTFDSREKVGMVLSVQDDTPENEKLLSGLEDLLKIQEGKLSLNEKQTKSWIQANVRRLVIDADFTGMIDTGFLASEDDHKDVERLSEAVEP